MFRCSCAQEPVDLNPLQQRCRPLLRATLTVSSDALHDDDDGGGGGVDRWLVVLYCFHDSGYVFKWARCQVI